MNVGFEWTFSTRIRERECRECRVKTTGYLTDLRTGVRKPLCSGCFLSRFGVRKAPSAVTLKKSPEEKLAL